MYFPNFLVSLLSCVRSRLCSADGVALLAPQLSRASRHLVIMTGSLVLPCAQQLYSCETHYPAPLTLQPLMAAVAQAPYPTWIHCIAFTLQHEFSVWDCTAEIRGGLHFTPLQKKVSWVFYLSRIVSVMQLHLSLQVP